MIETSADYRGFIFCMANKTSVCSQKLEFPRFFIVKKNRNKIVWACPIFFVPQKSGQAFALAFLFSPFHYANKKSSNNCSILHANPTSIKKKNSKIQNFR
jgi:hypothetical protein